jgi:hypothetical protein
MRETMLDIGGQEIMTADKVTLRLNAVASYRVPELPVQYADYAIWQRGEKQGPVLEEQLRYWQERFLGARVRSPYRSTASGNFQRPWSRLRFRAIG